MEDGSIELHQKHSEICGINGRGLGEIPLSADQGPSRRTPNAALQPSGGAADASAGAARWIPAAVPLHRSPAARM